MTIYLTKFEVTRILGLRCLQLQNNTSNNMMYTEKTVEKQAIRDLLNHNIDFVVRRYEDGHSTKDIHIKNCRIPSHQIQLLNYRLSL